MCDAPTACVCFDLPWTSLRVPAPAFTHHAPPVHLTSTTCLSDQLVSRSCRDPRGSPNCDHLWRLEVVVHQLLLHLAHMLQDPMLQDRMLQDRMLRKVSGPFPHCSPPGVTRGSLPLRTVSHEVDNCLTHACLLDADPIHGDIGSLPRRKRSRRSRRSSKHTRKTSALWLCLHRGRRVQLATRATANAWRLAQVQEDARRLRHRHPWV